MFIVRFRGPIAMTQFEIHKKEKRSKFIAFCFKHTNSQEGKKRNIDRDNLHHTGSSPCLVTLQRNG